MVRSEENITRTEKFKIAGIISVAVFVVSMMIWSSFEAHIQQILTNLFDTLRETKILGTITLIANGLALSIVAPH